MLLSSGNPTNPSALKLWTNPPKLTNIWPPIQPPQHQISPLAYNQALRIGLICSDMDEFDKSLILGVLIHHFITFKCRSKLHKASNIMAVLNRTLKSCSLFFEHYYLGSDSNLCTEWSHIPIETICDLKIKMAVLLSRYLLIFCKVKTMLTDVLYRCLACKLNA